MTATELNAAFPKNEIVFVRAADTKLYNAQKSPFRITGNYAGARLGFATGYNVPASSAAGTDWVRVYVDNYTNATNAAGVFVRAADVMNAVQFHAAIINTDNKSKKRIAELMQNIALLKSRGYNVTKQESTLADIASSVTARLQILDTAKTNGIIKTTETNSSFWDSVSLFYAQQGVGFLPALAALAPRLLSIGKVLWKYGSILASIVFVGGVLQSMFYTPKEYEQSQFDWDKLGKEGAELEALIKKYVPTAAQESMKDAVKAAAEKYAADELARQKALAETENGLFGGLAGSVKNIGTIALYLGGGYLAYKLLT